MISPQQTSGVQQADAQPIDADLALRDREHRARRVQAGRLASRMRAGARERRRLARELASPTPTTPRTHDSLGAFVAEDPRRELRNERELGDFWLGDGYPAAAWRAAWLPLTGELYVQRIGGVRPAGRVTVVAHFADEAALDERFDGWEEIEGTSGSVHWLLRRLGLDDSHLPATAGAGEA